MGVLVSGQLMQFPPASIASDLPRMEFAGTLNHIGRFVRPRSFDRTHRVGALRRVWASFFSFGCRLILLAVEKQSGPHPGDEKTIDDLLFVRGLDIAIDEPKVDDLFGMSVLECKTRVADRFRKTLLVASTNLRSFYQ